MLAALEWPNEGAGCGLPGGQIGKVSSYGTTSAGKQSDMWAGGQANKQAGSQAGE